MASTYGILTRFTHVRPQAGCFREMDLAVYQLLQSHAPGRQERREVLLTDTTLALLQDMWSKADHALTGHRKPSPFGRTQDASSSGSRDAAWSDPFKFLKSVARLWPALRVIFETTAVDLGATDETVEVDTDKLLGDSPLPDILSTIIAILNKALSCPDLDGARGDAILLPILKCFSSADSMDRDGPEDAPDEMARAAVSAFRMLERIGKEVPTFELCSSMVALLSTLADRGRVAEQTNERVSCLAIFCVRQSWPDATSERPADRGVLTSLIRTHLARSSEPVEKVEGPMPADRGVLTSLIRTHLARSSEPVEKVEALLTEVLDQMPKDSKKQNSAELEDYPCVTCGCFQPFFKVIIEHSSDAIVRLEGQVSSSPSDSDSAHLEELQGLSGSFASLLGLAKKWDDSEVLAACLKWGNRSLSSFTRLVPMMFRQLKHNKDAVKKAIKSIQDSTKVMQHICAHGKIKTDKRVIALVPYVKKNLETFLFKVKAGLSATNAMEGWWMGNMKHRDLGGKEIESSQYPMHESGEEEDNDGKEDDGEEKEDAGSQEEEDGNASTEDEEEEAVSD